MHPSTSIPCRNPSSGPPVFQIISSPPGIKFRASLSPKYQSVTGAPGVVTTKAPPTLISSSPLHQLISTTRAAILPSSLPSRSLCPERSFLDPRYPDSYLLHAASRLPPLDYRKPHVPHEPTIAKTAALSVAKSAP